MTRQISHRRSAFTLIEVLATVGMTVSVLTGVVVAISALHRIHRVMRNSIPAGSQVARWSAQFREDVHAARDAVVRAEPAGSDTLQLTQRDALTIDYQRTTDQITRVVSQGEAVLRRDSFRLPTDTDATWEVGTDRIVTLVLTRRTSKLPATSDASHITRIMASQGVRDWQ